MNNRSEYSANLSLQSAPRASAWQAPSACQRSVPRRSRVGLVALLAIACAAVVVLAGCSSNADVASANLSQAADNFEINRRVVFYNGITGDYILTIEGLCSLDASAMPKVSITCKVGPAAYKKHYLGVSNNVTWFIEQLDPAPANVYHYRVVFKPSVLAPDVRTGS